MNYKNSSRFPFDFCTTSYFNNIFLIYFNSLIINFWMVIAIRIFKVTFLLYFNTPRQLQNFLALLRICQ